MNIRDSKGVTKSIKLTFHFDLQIVPTVPNGFYTANKLVLLPKKIKTANV